MISFKKPIQLALFSVTTLFFILSTPLAILTAADPTCQPPDPSTMTGVHFPVGADSSSFTFQCDGTYANEWTNSYYVFNPSDNSRTALYDPNYGYNCTTNKWTMDEYDYSPADGQYHLNRVTTTAPAGYATNCPIITPALASGSTTDPASGGSGGDGSASASGISNTGSGSNNASNTNANNNTAFNNNTNASLTNTISGVSSSGNSLVLGNTTAGGAATGNSEDIANVVNMLQSTSNALGSTGNTVVFTQDIDGDVTGDLLFDPSQLANVQNAGSVSDTGPGSSNALNNNANNNLTVNNSTNANINNNVNLNANSGNATVSSNTTGGDATTGAARAVANIVNTINSALTAGKSFIGTININGNLNGDILLPANFVDTLLAANTPTVTITGPSSTNNVNSTTNANTVVNNTNNLGINNNVVANAASGSANVSGNTSGGNAKTGSANTSITAFNLTGSKVIGANDLLVFVNVSGKWVGVIVNAPAGATAASLGGGIASSGPNSSNNVSSTDNNNTTINNNTNAKINNNVNVNANSGNANVSNNTRGGNATSGDASSAVNLLNVENSNLSLSGWFGILFINVFGTWNGSFGINTSAGDPITNNAAAGSDAATLVSNAKLIQFVPGGIGGSNFFASTSNGGSGGGITATGAGTSGTVLAAKTSKIAPTPQLQNVSRNYTTFIVIGGLVVLYIVADAVISRRRQHGKIHV